MKQVTVLKKIENKNLPLRYMKRSNYFRNYKDSCGFNPETFEGHSYGWYVLTKKINETVLLNTYSYSNQTAKHVSKMRNLFSVLGIKYKALEAPKGLQDLDRAKEHVLYSLASALLANEHARIKSNYRINWYDRQLDVLKSLGVKVTKADIKAADLSAANDRARRLAKQAFGRRKKKLETYLETVANFRDYQIGRADLFGQDTWLARQVAVHQVVDMSSIEQDVENALYNFHRDGFGSIVFYV